MKTNKIDIKIKEKFENRTFEPSASAWERLSVQLDAQPKEKKVGWFFYIGVAASILLLVSIGIQLLSDEPETIIPKDEVVVSPIDTNSIDEKIDKLINEVPVQEAIVKKDKAVVEQQEKSKNIISTKEKSLTKKIEITSIEKDKIVIAKLEDDAKNDIKLETESLKERKNKILKQNPNSSIKIDADDLLYAVTHTPKEVKEYYAKYNINREDVLKTIKGELKKSNLKVNPETILAEVERTIIDDDFQNNFLKSLKRRVLDITTVIASRND